jgi:hypothetical protein
VRHRLVTEHGGTRHVSSVVLNGEEALDHLELEASMHESAGWDVSRGIRCFTAYRRGVYRYVTLRVSHEMDDEL